MAERLELTQEDERLQCLIEENQEELEKFLQPCEVMDFIQSLPAEVKERIQDCETNDRRRSVSMLVSEVRTSSQLLNQFCVALQRKGYERLFRAIVQEGDVTQEHLTQVDPENTSQNQSFTSEHFQCILTLLSGELVEKIVPSEITPYLIASECLKEEDRDRILAEEQRRGPSAGCREMFKLLPRRKENWAILFLEALQKQHKHLCTKLGIDDKELEKPTSCGATSKLCYDDEIMEEPVVRTQGGASETDGLKDGQDLDDKGPVFSDDEEEETSEKTTMNEGSSLKMRKYQLELAQEALQGRNTLICSGTGSGKTRVAVYIIKHHLEQRARNKETARVVFFARTVPLVGQQYRAISNNLSGHKILRLTGEDEMSMYLHQLLDKQDVIILTPQILVNHLKEGTINSLAVFSMLVFDECHHTQKGEPYNAIMKRYLKLKSEGEAHLPQILGLTASVGVGKATTEEMAIDNILRVCANMDVPYISTVEENMDEYKDIVSVPEDRTIPLEERQDDPVKDVLIKHMDTIEDELRDSRVMSDKACRSQLLKIPNIKWSQEYYNWTLTLKKAIQINIENEDIHRSALTYTDVLRTFNRSLEVNELLRTKDVVDHLLDGADVILTEGEKATETDKKLIQIVDETKKELNKILRDPSAENPKLGVILEYLKRCFREQGDDSRFIMFVRTRVAAVALSDYLNGCGFKCSHLTGTGSPEEEGGMTQTDQENTISKMKEGTLNGIIATTVAEEGIDIPDCNTILRYNHVGNEISTVQSKGRSRKKGGKSVLFANKKLAEREEMNLIRASLMRRAIATIKKMDPQGIQMTLKMVQEEILEEEEIKELISLGQHSKKRNEQFVMHCGKCQQAEVKGSCVKTFNQLHYVIVDPAFRHKIDKQRIKPKNFDGVSIFAHIVCKKCDNRLGKMIRKGGIDFPCIKIEAFVFTTINTGQKSIYKKWKMVPFEIEEADRSDYQNMA